MSIANGHTARSFAQTDAPNLIVAEAESLAARAADGIAQLEAAKAEIDEQIKVLRRVERLVAPPAPKQRRTRRGTLRTHPNDYDLTVVDAIRKMLKNDAEVTAVAINEHMGRPRNYTQVYKTLEWLQQIEFLRLKKVGGKAKTTKFFAILDDSAIVREEAATHGK